MQSTALVLAQSLLRSVYLAAGHSAKLTHTFSGSGLSRSQFCLASQHQSAAMLAAAAWPSTSGRNCASACHDVTISSGSLVSTLSPKPGACAHISRTLKITAFPKYSILCRMICSASQSENATSAAHGAAVLAERPDRGPQQASGDSGAESSNGNSGLQLEFVGSACVLPHPDKVAKGGEDGYFVCPNGRSIGVADGVGGWADVKIDAGLYAKMLMRVASEESMADCEARGHDAQLEAQSILERAHSKTKLQGSSTACVAVINGQRLQASNLGDSGFLVLRDSKVVYHTSQQQHGFNFPFQLGSTGANSDKPNAAQRHEIDVQPGDIILMGTDGLWDNCFDEEIIDVLQHCIRNGMTPRKIASVMAHYASSRASDPKFASPFAYSAYQAGFNYMGGKQDDITCLVALVQARSKL